MAGAEAIELFDHEAPHGLPTVDPGTVWVGKLLGKEAEGWLVDVGERRLVASVDSCVDPILLEEAAAANARVLLVPIDGSTPIIIGAVMTSRALTIDRRGNVDAAVERFCIKARKELLIMKGQNFLQMEGKRLELYAGKITARARETVRLWGRLIGLN